MVGEVASDHPGELMPGPDGHGDEWVAAGVGAGPLDATVGVAATGPADDPQSMADAEFIAAWDPSRVLRLVERDRKLLGDLQQPWHCQTCAYGPEFAGTMHECPVDEFRLKTLRDLAVFWLGEEPE